MSISSKNGNYVHKIGGVADHIHMFFSLYKTENLCTQVENLKKHSSRWIKTKGNQYESFAWQKGYGAFSICSTHKEGLSNTLKIKKNITIIDRFKKNSEIF